MHLGAFKSAAYHFRRSVARSRDPRRAQFLAAASEIPFIPRVHVDRGLRIAWSRLSDAQRTSVLEQLRKIVGNNHAIVQYVEAFIDGAFKPRRYEKSSEVARRAKINRMERKHQARDAARVRDRLGPSRNPETSGRRED